jgi:hypothetical protein
MYGTKRLGEWLIERGKITPQQLQEALEAQKLTGKRLGEILIEQGYITPKIIMRFKPRNMRCPTNRCCPKPWRMTPPCVC